MILKKNLSLSLFKPQQSNKTWDYKIIVCVFSNTGTGQEHHIIFNVDKKDQKKTQKEKINRETNRYKTGGRTVKNKVKLKGYMHSNVASVTSGKSFIKY